MTDEEREKKRAISLDIRKLSEAIDEAVHKIPESVITGDAIRVQTWKEVLTAAAVVAKTNLSRSRFIGSVERLTERKKELEGFLKQLQ